MRVWAGGRSGSRSLRTQVALKDEARIMCCGPPQPIISKLTYYFIEIFVHSRMKASSEIQSEQFFGIVFREEATLQLR